MAATVTIAEYNGVGATRTASVTNLNYGTVDEVNTDPVANPITPGSNSMEKWNALVIGAIDTALAIRNLRVFVNAAPTDADDDHFNNCHVTQLTYDGISRTNDASPGPPADEYVQPVATASAYATQAFVTSAPGTANLGIAGALTGTDMTATGHESDYLVHQVQTDALTVVGTAWTAITIRYDEVA